MHSCELPFFTDAEGGSRVNLLPPPGSVAHTAHRVHALSHVHVSVYLFMCAISVFSPSFPQMPKAVRRALIAASTEHGGLSEDEVT